MQFHRRSLLSKYLDSNPLYSAGEARTTLQSLGGKNRLQFGENRIPSGQWFAICFVDVDIKSNYGPITSISLSLVMQTIA